MVAFADLLAYPLTKGSRVTGSGPHGERMLAGRAARDAPPVAAMDFFHDPPGSLRGLERSLNVLLRMPSALGHSARLRAKHDVYRQISVPMRAGTQDIGRPAQARRGSI